MRSLLLTLAVALPLFVACSKDPEDTTIEDESSSGSSSGRRPGRSSTSSSSGDNVTSSGGGSSSGGSGSTVTDVCEGELALYRACELTDMNCREDGYVGWCKANNDASDSAQRIAGRLACLDAAAHCDPDDRAECIYSTYAAAGLSSAQQSLLTHYCAACEPADSAACENRVRTANATTDSIFLATWELAENLVTKIDAECIDGTFNPADCTEYFDLCAGEIYIEALVGDCPE